MSESCPNCAAALTGRFCAACGQDQAADRTVRAMLRDFGGELLGADSRLWRTLRVLVARPGLLSVEHRVGRRARYIQPTRLYLLVSVVFFSAVALAPVQLVRVGVDDDNEADAGVRPGTGIRLDLDTTRTDSLGAGAADSTRIVAAVTRAQDDPDRLNEIFLRSLAWVMFVLIPIFAALLRLLFRDAKLLYVQHFVFALHYHAFGFLTQAAAYLAMHLPLVGDAHTLLIGVANIANAFYLYFALRRFYGTSRVGTFGRMAALGIGYLLAIGLAMLGTVFFALLVL